MDDEARVVGVTDFLLELRSEEIPARMQAKAREDLARLFASELAKAGIAAGKVITYATPRRLALIARDLPDATAAAAEELKGPRTSAPPQALDGFLRKTGLTREQLTERDGVYFAISEKPGRATAVVLADAIPAIVRAFPWPKSMRWGDASASTDSLRWVRPLHGIVALFGEELVPVEIAGVVSTYATLGHRFHHPGPITLGGAHDYVEKLRACHVIVDQAEREALIRDRATALATEAGLEVVADEGLVAENAGLTEWPVPLLGRFDAAFLDVPPEVIQLTARVNQKYFVCRDAEGALANAFICTANIDAADGGERIVEGNRKVLAARLSDARFFYEQDAKVRLEDHAAKLDRIVFHEKLGTVADKVERVAKLARWLVEEGIVLPSPLQGKERDAEGGEGEGQSNPSPTAPLPTSLRSATLSPEGEREDLATLAERAARLAKADLVTGMVGEFPELQGVMGGYYARAQGEDSRVADAIRDHYKPVGQGDDVPTAPVTVAVSLADKLDTLLSFYGAGERSTGSKDPYALRRQVVGLIALMTGNQLRLPLVAGLEKAYRIYASKPKVDTLALEPGDLLEVTRPIFFKEIDGIADGKATTFFVYRDVEFDVPDWQEFELGFSGFMEEPKPLGVPVDDDLQNVYSTFQSFNQLRRELLPFFADRLKVQQREAGVRHDLIDAVFALGGEDDLVRLLARVRALQAFVGTEDGANLLVGYRRAANILKKEGFTFLSPSGERESREAAEGEGQSQPSPSSPLPTSLRSHGSPREPASLLRDAPGISPLAATPLSLEGERERLSYTPEPAEEALHAALDAAEPAAASAVAREDFGAAMAALASLRAPIDRFFDEVTVNDPDPDKRLARLQLLARVRDAVHTVADFSKIEG